MPACPLIRRFQLSQFFSTLPLVQKVSLSGLVLSGLGASSSSPPVVDCPIFYLGPFSFKFNLILSLLVVPFYFCHAFASLLTNIFKTPVVSYLKPAPARTRTVSTCLHTIVPSSRDNTHNCPPASPPNPLNGPLFPLSEQPHATNHWPPSNHQKRCIWFSGCYCYCPQLHLRFRSSPSPQQKIVTKPKPIHDLTISRSQLQPFRNFRPRSTEHHTRSPLPHKWIPRSSPPRPRPAAAAGPLSSRYVDAPISISPNKIQNNI